MQNYITSYRRYLRLQRGLSANTLEAYMHDLAMLLQYCEEKNRDPVTLELKDLQEFSASLHDLGIAPASHAGYYLA